MFLKNCNFFLSFASYFINSCSLIYRSVQSILTNFDISFDAKIRKYNFKHISVPVFPYSKKFFFFFWTVLDYVLSKVVTADRLLFVNYHKFLPSNLLVLIFIFRKISEKTGVLYGNSQVIHISKIHSRVGEEKIQKFFDSSILSSFWNCFLL